MYFEHYREKATGRIFGMVRVVTFFGRPADEDLVDYLEPLDGKGGRMRIRKTERAQRFEAVRQHLEWRWCEDPNPVEAPPNSRVEEDGA